MDRIIDHGDYDLRKLRQGHTLAYLPSRVQETLRRADLAPCQKSGDVILHDQRVNAALVPLHGATSAVHQHLYVRVWVWVRM